jgi:hypothetical protein
LRFHHRRSQDQSPEGHTRSATLEPGAPHAHQHSDRWHSDFDGNRLVALTINLGREPHHGARLQIADHRSLTVRVEVDNRPFGRAVLFELSDALRHRVTPIEPGPPRTVLAGWFQRQPTLHGFFHPPEL